MGLFYNAPEPTRGSPANRHRANCIGTRAAGFVCCVAPMVLSETCPHKYRGAFGTVHQLSVTIGIFVSSVFGLPQLMGQYQRSSAASVSLSAFFTVMTVTQGCSGAGTRGWGRPPTFFRQGESSRTLPPTVGLKFVQTLVHCCNWLLTETQCEIISVQQN